MRVMKKHLGHPQSQAPSAPAFARTPSGDAAPGSALPSCWACSLHGVNDCPLCSGDTPALLASPLKHMQLLRLVCSRHPLSTPQHWEGSRSRLVGEEGRSRAGEWHCHAGRNGARAAGTPTNRGGRVNKGKGPSAARPSSQGAGAYLQDGLIQGSWSLVLLRGQSSLAGRQLGALH